MAQTLRDALRACRPHLFYVVVFSFALNILYLAPSIFMLQVYDRVMTSGGMLTLLYISIVLVASLGTLSFLDATRMRLLAAMSKRFDRLVAPTLLWASLQREGRAAAGKAHALRELDSLRAAMSGQPAIAAIDAPWTPLYIIVCFLIHPYVGFLALGGGTLLVLIAFINQQSMHRALHSHEQATGAMYALQMADTAQGETARSLGMQEALVQRQLRSRQTMTDAVNSSTRSSASYSASTKFTRLVLQSAALALGAVLALKQEISAGGIIASSILTARAYAPLELIVGAWRQFEQGRSAYKVVNNVLRATENPREYTTLPPPRGELSLEHVGVKSPGGERVLLYGANFRVPAGEIVGVIGPSGAGKTTLIRVIAGATLPDTGAVRLDGAKLTDWPSDDLGQHIGYLPQDVGLFSGTIAENISRFDTGDPELIDRGIVDAAKAAGVHELILALPKGYDTEIGANGRGLSAGQAQRVALARALYGDPVLIVLDEPNAHLDQEGEAALIRTLTAARERGATSVVVAHRTGFMNIADKLLIVNDGRVEAFGPREQILQRLQSGAGGPGGPRPVVVSSSDPARRP